MAVIIDGTTGVATPGVTDTGDLSVAGNTTLTTPLPVTSGGTGASSLSGIAVGNLAGGSAGTIPYQSTVGTTAMLATGTSGQALVSAGPSAAPAWGTPFAATTATTATNLAGGSAGTVPYQTASGTTAMLAAGTSGQALLSGGAGAPTWGSAGAFTYINTYTASGSATLDIPLTGSYTSFQIIFTNLVPATNGTNIKIQYTTNNFSSSTDWENCSAYGYSSGGTLTGTASAGVFIQGKANTAVQAAAGSLMVINPFSAGTVVRQVTGLSNGGHYLNGFYTCTFSGANDTSAALNGVRILAASGNLTTGTFKLYGIT